MYRLLEKRNYKNLQGSLTTPILSQNFRVMNYVKTIPMDQFFQNRPILSKWTNSLKKNVLHRMLKISSTIILQRRYKHEISLPKSIHPNRHTARHENNALGRTRVESFFTSRIWECETTMFFLFPPVCYMFALCNLWTHTMMYTIHTPTVCCVLFSLESVWNSTQRMQY